MQISFNNALKKAYLKEKIDKEKFENFLNALEFLKKEINEEESEEYNKNLIKDFFQRIEYEKVNTYENIDLAIYNNNRIEVLIETKSPSNKTQMITTTDFLKKAFFEALLYFLRESIKKKNYYIKHIIITNTKEWFIFDAVDFDKIIPNELKKIYKDFEINKTLFKQKTSDFYAIAKEKLPKNLSEKLNFIYFNIHKKYSPNQLKNIYKIFSKKHLLKEFILVDANSLNKNFYYELLYILGLKEVSQKGKKLIKRGYIKGSLIENTILKLKTECDIKEEELFDIALELNITWLNRILFLKLLEAKLIKVHNQNFPKFLDFNITNEFDKLNTLFFEVLSVKEENRENILIKEYKKLPYLNSSLFEVTTLERKYLRISNLKNTFFIKPFEKSVLKEKKELNTLEYLLKFLSSFDFGSESEDEFKKKSLINSAVLGLIFEKINGYKEGSFFTPSFITTFMTKEVLKRKIVDKFNEEFNLSLEDFEELKKYCEANFYKKEFLKKANNLIDNIKIVDPAVGSGHFLVSALNELIVIKNELNLFLPSFIITNENDELYFEDKRSGELFEYKIGSNYSKEIEKTIFNEKQKIIENQLFGVDINPNSVKIARLRLWIELLKSCYYEDGFLVTLPNIDINIKEGNSLLSRFDTKNQILNNNIKNQLKIYKQNVKEYKETNDKEIKKEIESTIKKIKEMINNFFLQNQKEYKKLNELLALYRASSTYEELSQLPEDLALMALKAKNKTTSSLFEKADTKKLLKEIEKFYNDIKQKEQNYKNSFEWRFEFPEVLDEEGNFVGFDIVLANPPYGVDVSIEKNFFMIKSNESAILFIELAKNLLKEKGIHSFIIPKPFIYATTWQQIRDFLKNELILIADCGKAWSDVKLEEIVYISYKNKKVKEYENYVLKENKRTKIAKINKKFINEFDFIINKVNRYEIDLALKIKKESTSLSNLIVSAHWGDTFFKEIKNFGDIKVLAGKNIQRYKIDDIKGYISKDLKVSSNAFIQKNSILLQRIIAHIQNPIDHIKITGTLSDNLKNFYIVDTVMQITLKSEVSNRYILALLHSKLLNWYIYRFIFAKAIRTFQFNSDVIKKIPIKLSNKDITKKIENLVDEIIKLKKEDIDTTPLEKEIDKIVYEIYNLTQEEKKIVEGQI